jgi:hypothetical protein
VVLVVGLLVSIAALIAVYDGKPTPEWGGRINLNALLALLSTILRATLVVVVSQIISQRKWEWYVTPCYLHGYFWNTSLDSQRITAA